MKIIEPTALLREAAAVLAGVKDDVVVVGAAAVEVALHGAPAAITPTRDVDAVVGVDDVDTVVEHLEAAKLKPSQEDHERGFTWIRDDLKVQLIRGFHPFAHGASANLPVNPIADAARSPAHREEVAFAGHGLRRRLWVASPACLVALKHNAFGRTKPPGNEVVRRDFHDVYLLVEHAADQVLASYEVADGGVRRGVREAVALFFDEHGDPLRLAGEEMVRLGEAGSQRDAEAEIRISMREIAARL